MKRILGLDLGTNSIGWALVNEAETDEEGCFQWLKVTKMKANHNPVVL